MKKKPHWDYEWLENQLMIHGSARQVALHNNIQERTVQRHVKKMRQQQLKNVSERIMNVQLPLQEVSIMQETVITGNGVVASDLHVPITSLDVLRRIVEEAIKYGCTDYLVIAGDLFNFDALSDYLPKQPDTPLGSELKAAEDILIIMLDVFKDIYITKGNHDVRMQKVLGYKLRFEHTIKMCFSGIPKELLGRIHITANDYLMIDTPNGLWRCSHTNAYSKNPLSIPRELCDIHLCHNAAAHRHHHAIGKSKSGKHYAVELGGAFDTSRTMYLRNYTTTFPVWVPGFMVLCDGEPYLPMLSPVPLASSLV